MGFSAMVGRRHALVPTRELLISSPRGEASVATGATVVITLAANVGYVLGCGAVLLLASQSHYNNGFTLRIAAPLIESFALVVIGYLIGRTFPGKIVPGLVAVFGYFLMTEPHYFHRLWGQLAQVQQEQFNAWFVANNDEAIPFLVWMLALSGLALALMTLSNRWLSLIVAMVSLVAASACVISLYRGQWGDGHEFVADRQVELICDENHVTCIHPAYSSVQRDLRVVADSANVLLGGADIGPLTYEQTPLAFGITQEDIAVPVDVFSDSRMGLRIGVSEGLNAWFLKKCDVSNDLPSQAYRSISGWAAGMSDDRSLLRELKDVNGLTFESADAALSELNC
jgi:hypothetical protein